MSKHYQPTEHQRFWCTHCDAKIVDSQDPSTGHFRVAFGHQYSDQTKQYDGEYVGVMFAVCNVCDTYNKE